MATLATGWVQAHPSFVEPDIINQLAQASGFLDLLSGSKLRTKISETDLYVYIKRMNVTTITSASQAAFTWMESPSINMSMVSTATYHIQNRSIYGRQDEAMAGQWGFGLPDALEKAQLQGHYQTCRNACLYGIVPSNNEGIINAPGVVSVTLPADSENHTTLLTYDNGEMSQFLSQTLINMLTTMYQAGMPQEVAILAPQRVLLYMQGVAVVQLVQWQRDGAGSDSTTTMFEKLAAEVGVKVRWGFDDTLIGKGAGGSDLMIMTIPSVKIPDEASVNTDEFGNVMPNLKDNVLQYNDLARPRKVISPLPYGMTEQVLEWRISSGWPVRSESVSLVSIPYS